MNDDKVQELLLQLLSDMSYIKAKLDNIDEQKLNTRIDTLEAKSKEHDRVIKGLEKRNETLEKFVRDNLNDSKKVQTSVFISLGLAVFTAILTFIFSLFK